MLCFRRGFLVVAGLSLGLVLSGCGSFDPMDWFSNKKPLPGKREAVFPGGVPGVAQGIPPDLVRGNERAVDPATLASVEANTPAGAPQAAAAKPAAKPKPKVASRPKSRPRPKRARARAAPPSPAPAPTQVTVQPSRPQPAGQQPASANSSVWGPTPGQGAAAPWPAPTTQRVPTAPWPEAPSPGTFSR